LKGTCRLAEIPLLPHPRRLLPGASVALSLTAAAQEAGKRCFVKDDTKADAPTPIIPKDSTTQGSVTVAGHTINYQAVAGTILVAATNDADAALGMSTPPVKENPDAPPTARMFYVAYFKKDVPPESRP
jgi:hypothetical protein